MKVVVIGGGVAGMFTSYYLLKAGHSVTIIDRDIDEDRSSIFNAGFITPSFTSAPTKLSKLIAATILPRGPLYISLAEVLRNPRWFRKGLSSGLSGFEETALALGKRSLALYEEFFKSESVQVDIVRGVVALFGNVESARKTAREVGGRVVDSSDLDPMGFRGFGGGVYLDELSINPLKLYTELGKRLTEMGASFRRGKMASVKMDGNLIAKAMVDEEVFEGDAFVIAAGAGSRALCRQVGYDPQILPARGLAMIFETGGEKIVEHPAFFEDLGISLSQHNDNTFRMTSYFELTGYKTTFSESRKKYILEAAAAHLYNYGKLKLIGEGVGFRPCAPDQLPVVGRVPGVDNAWIASGNCREGVILAPVTGFMVSEMISGNEIPDLPVRDIDPMRFLRSRPAGAATTSGVNS